MHIFRNFLNAFFRTYYYVFKYYKFQTLIIIMNNKAEKYSFFVITKQFNNFKFPAKQIILLL